MTAAGFLVGFLLGLLALTEAEAAALLWFVLRLRRRRGSGGLGRLLSVSSLAPTCGSASRWPRGAALQGRIGLGLCFRLVHPPPPPLRSALVLALSSSSFSLRYGAAAAVGLRCSGNGRSSGPVQVNLSLSLSLLIS
ncbi:hypothetical protein VPH35_014596 [Triticum aestivum]